MVITIDVIPFVMPLLKRKVIKEKRIDKNSFEHEIISQALRMINGQAKDQNFWHESKGFTHTVYQMFFRRNNVEFKLYNYPTASRLDDPFNK